MKKRNIVRIISFVGALIVTLGIWGVLSTVRLHKANMSIRQTNERALTQLGTYLDDITLNLQKSMYVGGDSLLSEISTDLWRSSVSAKESLSEIAGSDASVSGVYKFLSQVGEYTLAVNEKISSGISISQSETDNLDTLLQYSRVLSNTVNYLIEQEETGALGFDEIEKALEDMDADSLSIGDQNNDGNQSLSDYPTLIYDGPFSDHIADKTSEMLKNEKAVSREDAMLIAAEFIGAKTEEMSFLGYAEGNLPTYTFFNDRCAVSVTKMGGLVNYMLADGYVEDIVLSSEDAVKKATEYLENKGYNNMRSSYYSINDGVCTVNFTYYSGGITYYTDLIKVSVALDKGEIIAFDATGYIMNHKKRDIPENVTYNPTEAKSIIRDTLTVISYKRAVIPTEWETEEYVYEYHCVDKNKQEVLVYLDPIRGEERDVLLLMYGDGGVLTK